MGRFTRENGQIWGCVQAERDQPGPSTPLVGLHDDERVWLDPDTALLRFVFRPKTD